MAKKLRVKNKMKDLGVSRFSISSFNSFRTNRLQWFLRYVLGFSTSYEMFSAWRGQAIEFSLTWGMWRRKEVSIEDVIGIAIKSYQYKVLKHLLALFKVQVPNFDYKKLPDLLRTLPKEEFPSKVKLIIDSHFQLDSQQEYKFLIPGDKENIKYLAKLEKQYNLIQETIPLLFNKFMEEWQDEGLKYQTRIRVEDYYNLSFPVLGYADWIGSNFGIDLKTVEAGKLPRDWNSVPINHKCQAAFYSNATGKPWKLLYASRLSSDDSKNNFIIESLRAGKDSKAIMDEWKTLNGSGTTAKYIEKIQGQIKAGEIDLVVPYKEFDLPKQEIPRLEEINRFTGESILRMINSSRVDNMIEDLKYFCLGDLEHLYMKKDEKAEIEKQFGFALPEPQFEEEQEL